MPTLVELEQLLDISLTTPEVGTVNFNILRVFLREILRHLGIQNKMIDIDETADELKSAYDFIKDGYVEVSSGSPEPARPHTEPVKKPQAESTVRPQTEPTEVSQAKVEPAGVQETEIKEEQTEGELEGQPKVEQAAEKEQEKEKEGQPKVEQPGEEQPQVLVVESKTESLVSSSPTPKPSGLTVKEPAAPSRSAVMLLGRSDSLKSLKKKVSELQERVEFLESRPTTPPPPVPDPVRSAASLVRKDSKTPAHDFVELINIKRKLEASETSLEGLTEMVDALTTDLDELKNRMPHGLKETYNDMRNDMKELKVFFGKQDSGRDEEINKRLGNLEDNAKRIEELESILANLKEEATGERETVVTDQELPTKDLDLPRPVSEALKLLDEHEKQIQELKAQIGEAKGRIEGTDNKSNVLELAANEAVAKLKECIEGINNMREIMTALEKQLKEQKFLIEDNEMQIHQLKNTFSLMKRESLQRANEEAEKQKEKEKVVEEEPAPRRSYSTDRDELSLIRTMIFDLQEEKDKLKQTDIRLSDELYMKQKHLDDLYNLVDELRDLKADKELLSMGFELKADKREVETKIGREDFEHYMSLVDQSLRDLLQRLDGHEDALKQALEGLNTDVGKKLDKEEVEPLKRYLEARMETLKPKPVKTPPPEEFAAGIRKQFLVNHNCISCDRPVKYARDEAFPPLPTIHSMPGSKSNRPYTTFELEQIRQHMLHRGLDVGKERFELMDKQRNKLQKEILRLSGVRDLQELAEVTARACGGVHTLTYPHSQAVVRGLQLNSEFEFLVPQKDIQPVDILGQDGHIYKGLLESLPTLPHIPQKSKSAGMKNPPRNFRRSTTPTSPNVQKNVADELESA